MSSDEAEANAAWVLFLRSADRRAWLWMREDVQALDDGSAFFARKLMHVEINHDALNRAMKQRGRRLGETFLGRPTVEGIGPWGTNTPP